MGLPTIPCILAFEMATALAQSPATFTPAGNLAVPREFHTATLLPNGKVLIAGGHSIAGSLTPGGQTSPFQSWESAELYDPVTSTSRATGSMAPPRSMHTATLLNNRPILIAGASRFQTAELYDPSTGPFSAAGEMTEPGAETATLLANGKVLST